jgi:hypothetical protein
MLHHCTHLGFALLRDLAHEVEQTLGCVRIQRHVVPGRHNCGAGLHEDAILLPQVFARTSASAPSSVWRGRVQCVTGEADPDKCVLRTSDGLVP